MAYTYDNANEALKRSVWDKGRAVVTHNAAVHRRDICGSWMQYNKHGKEIFYGWEIDHINPSSNGGSDKLSNLQPLQWQNNRRKGDTYPWSC